MRVVHTQFRRGDDAANLDDGAMWPTAFALEEMTPDAEARIATLVRKAVS